MDIFVRCNNQGETLEKYKMGVICVGIEIWGFKSNYIYIYILRI